jgi:hypothetical protein
MLQHQQRPDQAAVAVRLQAVMAVGAGELHRPLAASRAQEEAGGRGEAAGVRGALQVSARLAPPQVQV